MVRSDSGASQPGSFAEVAQASVGGAPLSAPGLSRSGSVRSNRSGRSASSSAGSTLGAGAGAGSGRKVTPLYNLTFHAVMTTVVTDAGQSPPPAHMWGRKR